MNDLAYNEAAPIDNLEIIPMRNARVFRILLFSGMVVALFTGGVCAADSQARPLHDIEISLSKTASPATFSSVGEMITYAYMVTNNSGYLMYDVIIDDDLVTVTCPSSEIEGGMTGPHCESESEVIRTQMTCTGTYVITQADIDNGQVTNAAAANGTYDIPGGCGGIPQVFPVSANTSLTITAIQQPSISLAKTGSPTTFHGSGEVINYSYTVENTGNVSLAGPITITDDKVTVSCPSGGLAPGDTMVCTASYTTTEADVVTGFILNTAIADAGAGITASDDFEILLEDAPELTLEKSASTATYTEYWELIVYTYVVTNTGNVPLNGPFLVQDPLLDEWNCPETTSLGVGDTITCLGYYRTRTPLGGAILNCATVEGTYLGDPVISNEACVQVEYQSPQDPFGAGG